MRVSATSRFLFRATTLGLALFALSCNLGPSSDAPEKPKAKELTQALRVVSLSPAIDESLTALGHDDLLVGISDYSESALKLPRVGTLFTPNYEALAKAEPTLIIATEIRGANLAALEPIASTLILPWLTTSEIAASLERLGQLTDSAVEARKLAQEFRSLPSEASAGARRILLVFPTTGALLSEVWYLKKNSLHGAILHQAGGKNAVDHAVEGAPRLSLEELLRTDPDGLIILTSQDMLGMALEMKGRLAALKPLRAAPKIAIVTSNNPLGVGPSVLSLIPRLRAELEKMDLAPHSR